MSTIMSEIELTNAEKLFLEMKESAIDGVWTGFIKNLSSVTYPSQVLKKMADRGAVIRLSSGSFGTESVYQLLFYPSKDFVSTKRMSSRTFNSQNFQELERRIEALERNYATLSEQILALSTVALSSQDDGKLYNEAKSTAQKTGDFDLMSLVTRLAEAEDDMNE